MSLWRVPDKVVAHIPATLRLRRTGWRRAPSSKPNGLLTQIRHQNQARKDIANWIHTWYNQQGPHSTFHVTSPINYEKPTRQPNQTLQVLGGTLNKPSLSSTGEPFTVQRRGIGPRRP